MGSHSAHPKRKTQYTVVLAQHLIRLSQKSPENLVKSICSVFGRLISGQPTEIMWCPLLSSAPCSFEHRHKTYEMGICFICCSSPKQWFIEILSTWAWRPQLLPKRCVILGCSERKYAIIANKIHISSTGCEVTPQTDPKRHQNNTKAIESWSKMALDLSQTDPKPDPHRNQPDQTIPKQHQIRKVVQWVPRSIEQKLNGISWNIQGSPQTSMDTHGYQ